MLHSFAESLSLYVHVKLPFLNLEKCKFACGIHSSGVDELCGHMVVLSTPKTNHFFLACEHKLSLKSVVRYPAERQVFSPFICIICTSSWVCVPLQSRSNNQFYHSVQSNSFLSGLPFGQSLYCLQSLDQKTKNQNNQADIIYSFSSLMLLKTAGRQTTISHFSFIYHPSLKLFIYALLYLQF